MFTSPERNVARLGIQLGHKVADIGAGSGYYSILVGRLVGGMGRVYAIDVMHDLLVRLKNEASKAKVNNIEIVHGNAEVFHGTKLKDASVDRAIASNIFHQIEDRDTFLLETKRILKPGGKLLLIDYDTAGIAGGVHHVSKEEVRMALEKAGFIFEEEFDAGSTHYGFIARRGM